MLIINKPSVDKQKPSSFVKIAIYTTSWKSGPKRSWYKTFQRLGVTFCPTILIFQNVLRII